MGESRTGVAKRKGNWRFYLISALGFLITIVLLALTIYYREEIRAIGGYGYIGVFVVGVLCGISIIPAPTLIMVFTLGAVLNPAYVGITAGVGGAIGGITVYLTGAGVESVWSRFRTCEEEYINEPGWRYDPVRPVESRMWADGERLYNRLTNFIGGKGGAWTLFVISALPISPFYFAGLAAGSCKMGLLKFFFISGAGKIVRYLLVAYAGYLGLSVLLRWIGA